MILLLVKLRLALMGRLTEAMGRLTEVMGRLTEVILWTRKSHK